MLKGMVVFLSVWVGQNIPHLKMQKERQQMSNIVIVRKANLIGIWAVKNVQKLKL